MTETFYHKTILSSQKRIAKLKKQLIVMSLVRFLMFLLTLATPYFFYERFYTWAFAIMVLPLAVFLFMVTWYARVSRKKKFETLKVEINEKEIEALKHKFAQFNGGAEFIDPNHMNSYDLDLFGKGSLFQFLNRTVTPKGKIKLAGMLQNPILKPESIKQRQEYIDELKSKPEWRQDFTVNGLMDANDEQENKLFDSWSNQQFSLRSIKYVRLFIPVLSLMGTISIVVWSLGGGAGLFTLALILQVGFYMYESKNIKDVYEQFGKRADVLQKYTILLEAVEQFSWQSNEGKALQKKLHEAGLPSIQINRLRKIITTYDNRNNLLFGIILNLMFSWDYLHTYLLIRWHHRNSANYKLWIETIAFVDACNSLANYAYNHPSYTYPAFCEDSFHINAVQLGHPLINPTKMIANDFEFGGTYQTIIVTGANMSGKSTFLRTVGVNMVLGMAGAPVCAKVMNFKPVEVFSNMRTTDSLFDDESYFFAELKRLKFILDEVEKGKELLIILDEILKGTNSVDKLYGSQKLVQRLVANQTPSIIATHDLKLTEIEQEYPASVKNKCFEITIDNDEMQFDYQLRNGVTTIMNATFLMKKMGIID